MSYHCPPRLTPLEVCEALIGPQPLLEAICDLRPKSIYQWRRPAAGRDPGDIPSARHMRALLAFSNARGLCVTAEHLIHGADAAEIEELQATQRLPEAA